MSTQAQVTPTTSRDDRRSNGAGELRRVILIVGALVVLAAGLIVGVCPLINRPWAYDLNPSPAAGAAAAAVSVMLAFVLLAIPNRRRQASASSLARQLGAAVAGVSAVLVLVGAVWHFHFEDRLTAKRFGVVVPAFLYRSGQISTFMLEPTLAAHRIDAVIDLNGLDPADDDQRYEIETLERCGIEAHRFKLEGDGRGDVEHYVQAVKTIEECRRAGKCVLVHCAAGSQRTGGVVAVYRLLVRHDSMAPVIDELRRYGWRPGQDAVLLDYLNENLSTIAARLRDEGVIERIPDPLPRLGADG